MANSAPVQAASLAKDPNVTTVDGTSLSVDPATGAVALLGPLVAVALANSLRGKLSRLELGSPPAPIVPDVALKSPAPMMDRQRPIPTTEDISFFEGQLAQVGGMSWGAPTWADFSAMINQARANLALVPTTFWAQ